MGKNLRAFFAVLLGLLLVGFLACAVAMLVNIFHPFLSKQGYSNLGFAMGMMILLVGVLGQCIRAIGNRRDR